MNTSTLDGPPIIACYIGDELYPNANDPSQVGKTLDAIKSSKLTCPILGLVNYDTNSSAFVYNNGPNRLFDGATGTLICPSDFTNTVSSQVRTGMVNKVFLSFSTSACDQMAAPSMQTGALQALLKSVKEDLGCDGIDLDYEGGSIEQGSAIYVIAKAAIEVGLQLTAAPYFGAQNWQDWVTFVKNQGGTVAWLNLQCYSGGAWNSPSDWMGLGAPLVPGVQSNGSGCPPESVETLYRFWRYGLNGAKLPMCNCCYNPGKGGQEIAGGFMWVYNEIAPDFKVYMQAIHNGVMINTPLNQ